MIAMLVGISKVLGERFLCSIGLHRRFRQRPWFVSCQRDGCEWEKIDNEKLQKYFREKHRRDEPD
jgi:hypothetical protein